MSERDPFRLLTERLAARQVSIEAVVVGSSPGAPAPGSRAILDPRGRVLAGAWATGLAEALGPVAAGLGLDRPSILSLPRPGLEVFLIRWGPAPRVVLFGGGHVGRAIAALLPGLEFETVVVEDRDFFADPKRFPPGVKVHRAELARGADELGIGEGDLAVVCTRGHKEDLDCVRSLLRRSPAYLGLLGSRRKLREFAAVLESEGFERGRIDAVRCPVGLDLGAESPEEIALAVAAELVAFRRGRALGAR